MHGGQEFSWLPTCFVCKGSGFRGRNHTRRAATATAKPQFIDTTMVSHRGFLVLLSTVQAIDLTSERYSRRKDSSLVIFPRS